jgi:hypothetical protein
MKDELTLFNPDMLTHLEKMAATLSKSGLMPEALRGKPGDILVTLMTGAELGLQPMQSLRSIAVVKGKPALSADLMVSLVKQRKEICEFLILVKSTPLVATYKAKRVGEPEPTEMSFTMEDAQRAGLTGQGGMYAKYPAQMLRARCASGICRAVFPDLCMGLYDSDSGELTEGKPLERELNPAPAASRVEEVRQDLKRSGPIVDVQSGETEEQAKERQEPPKVLPGNGYAALTEHALSTAIDEAHIKLETAPNGTPIHKALKARLGDLEAEVERRAQSAEVGT